MAQPLVENGRLSTPRPKTNRPLEPSSLACPRAQEFIAAQAMDEAKLTMGERAHDAANAHDGADARGSAAGEGTAAAGSGVRCVAVQQEDTVPLLEGKAPLLPEGSTASDAPDPPDAPDALDALDALDARPHRDELSGEVGGEAWDGRLPAVAAGPVSRKRGTGSHRYGTGSCWDCAPGRRDACRLWLHSMVSASWFGHASTVLVLVNMGLMCMPYAGMSGAYEAALERLATLITWVFIVEMGLKLVAVGCAAYWADGWNVLDGSIVTMSILEMVLTAIFTGGGLNLSFLRILRMLRVLRMLRLMKSWKGLYKVVTTFGKALPQMGNIFVLMFLVALIFSLLGMQLLGGVFTPEQGFYNELDPATGFVRRCPNGLCPPQRPPQQPLRAAGGWADDQSEDAAAVVGEALVGLVEMPRYHFDYFGPAMLTSFVVMTGVWVDAMVPAYQAIGGAAIAFYIAALLIGLYLLTNLLN